MKKILLLVCLCLVTSLAFASKPEWAGKGKPEREDVEAIAEQMKDSERRGDILDRRKPGKGKKDKDHDDDQEFEDDDDYDEEDHDKEFECELSKEECAALRAERKAERMAEKEARKAERMAEKEAREAERAERGNNAAQGEGRRQNGERGNNAARAERAEQSQNGGQQATMQKQAEMKAEMEQKELDKGSAKGQEIREANSKKWWQFWK